ncbi:MAG TPA: hypothetical protein VKT82_09700 [Ktedonobacterales bacterium]|nr:hypothetical protein [Ktedonobacterales bacterium]
MMRHSGRSGQVRSGTGCPAGVRRPRLGSIDHRPSGPALPSLAAFDEGLAAALVRMELARALRQLLRAPDSREACAVVVHNPILLVESATELLRATVEEAERNGDAADKAMLMSYLRVLELARETSVLSANSEADQAY